VKGSDLCTESQMHRLWAEKQKGGMAVRAAGWVPCKESQTLGLQKGRWVAVRVQCDCHYPGCLSPQGITFLSSNGW
jgi:hypothetical protein